MNQREEEEELKTVFEEVFQKLVISAARVESFIIFMVFGAMGKREYVK